MKNSFPLPQRVTWGNCPFNRERQRRTRRSSDSLIQGAVPVISHADMTHKAFGRSRYRCYSALSVQWFLCLTCVVCHHASQLWLFITNTTPTSPPDPPTPRGKGLEWSIHPCTHTHARTHTHKHTHTHTPECSHTYYS